MLLLCDLGQLVIRDKEITTGWTISSHEGSITLPSDMFVYITDMETRNKCVGQVALPASFIAVRGRTQRQNSLSFRMASSSSQTEHLKKSEKPHVKTEKKGVVKRRKYDIDTSSSNEQMIDSNNSDENSPDSDKENYQENRRKPANKPIKSITKTTTDPAAKKTLKSPPKKSTLKKPTNAKTPEKKETVTVSTVKTSAKEEKKQVVSTRPTRQTRLDKWARH